MTSRFFKAVALAAFIAIAKGAWAGVPAPLVPTALVEEVKSTTADVEFMDYVGSGQMIKLAPRDILVLSYLKSCAHEIVTGGTVIIGEEHSDVQGGKIVRSKVPCDGGEMRLSSQQANASGATAFRLQSVSFSPTLYAIPPVVQIPRGLTTDDRTLVIERINRPRERYEINLGAEVAPGAFFDLAKAGVRPLVRGATYNASLGGRQITFKVHSKAGVGKRPVISRLLRFPAG